MKNDQSRKKWKFRVTLVQDLGNPKNRYFKNRYFQNVKSRNRGMKIDLPWSQQLKRRQRFRRVEKLSYLPEN